MTEQNSKKKFLKYLDQEQDAAVFQFVGRIIGMELKRLLHQRQRTTRAEIDKVEVLHSNDTAFHFECIQHRKKRA